MIILSLRLSLRFNGHFPDGSGLAGTRTSSFWIYWSKDDGRGGDKWSYKTCKAPVKSSPTNQHPVFLQTGCPSVVKPTASEYILKLPDTRLRSKSNVFC